MQEQEQEIARKLMKLRVKPGLRGTSVQLHDDPWLAVDLFYDRDIAAFCMRARWRNGTKTIEILPAAIRSSKHRWRTDATHRLTEDEAHRLAPGLSAMLAKLVELSALRAKLVEK